MTPHGLQYIPNYIVAQHQQQLLNQVAQHPWQETLQRRVQHYGYVYDYRKRTINPELYLGELPIWLLNIAQQLQADNYISDIPDQVIINEYQPGQGVAAHIDCEPCFGDTILSLSLGSITTMIFKHQRTGKVFQQILESGSLVVLKNDARYEWTHAIPARKTDIVAGRRISRSKRISLTFRKVIVNGQTAK